jgi:hypothetical protein
MHVDERVAAATRIREGMLTSRTPVRSWYVDASDIGDDINRWPASTLTSAEFGLAVTDLTMADRGVVPMQLQLQQLWTLGEPIGAGRFGQVYAATSAAGQTAVAKLVPKVGPPTPSPTGSPGTPRWVWVLLILLAAVLAGVVAGLLSHAGGASVPNAILDGGSWFSGAVVVLVGLAYFLGGK